MVAAIFTAEIWLIADSASDFAVNSLGIYDLKIQHYQNSAHNKKKTCYVIYHICFQAKWSLFLKSVLFPEGVMISFLLWLKKKVNAGSQTRWPAKSALTNKGTLYHVVNLTLYTHTLVVYCFNISTRNECSF